jgi:hypothetical protein
MTSSFRTELDRLTAEFISTVFAAMQAATLSGLAAAPSGPTLPSSADGRPRAQPILSRATRSSLRRPDRGHRISKRAGITHTEQRALRLERAREWKRQLDAGEISSRAAIARREGLSRARVTQLMNLLGKRR